MKICKYILWILVLSSTTGKYEVFGIMDTKRTNNNDSIFLNLNDSIQVEEIVVKWNSLVTEESVEPDGSFGGLAVNLGIQLTGRDTEETWYITLPVPYKEYIRDQPDKVSYGFGGYTFTIIGADFEKLDTSSFIILNLQKVIEHQASYYIDYMEVSELDFMALFNALKEVEGTWYCAETREGGITGYDMRNPHNDKKYSYRSETENGITKVFLSKGFE
jgi:hypothetical protein